MECCENITTLQFQNYFELEKYIIITASLLPKSCHHIAMDYAHKSDGVIFHTPFKLYVPNNIVLEGVE